MKQKDLEVVMFGLFALAFVGAGTLMFGAVRGAVYLAQHLHWIP